MPRFFLRLTLFPVVFLAAALLLIHSKPYDDHEIRELLQPIGCPAPCFMGIRPGVTTMDEVVKITQANEWVDVVDRHVLDKVYGLITLTWNDQKPNWIKKNQPTEIFLKNKLVTMITIYTNIPIGEVMLTLGLPDMEVVEARKDQSKQFVYYYAFYPQLGLSMQNWIRCDVHEPLYHPVNIIMSEPKTYVLHHMNSLRDVSRACQK